MYPILYENITAGTVPAHRGLGTLSDCISCTVEQSRNGAYELTMTYPLNGIHAADLAKRRIIKAKPNYTDNPQLFRISRIGAVMNEAFTVYAKHISYDLSGYPISSGTAGTAAMACNILEGAASGYQIRTDKTTTGTFSIYEPASVRSYFGGRTGSFLDIYGPAEIKYDNFRVDFLNHAGQDRGVTVRYKKNLLELSQEIDSSNLYTAVLCFAKDEDGNITAGSQVPTGLTLDVPKVLVIDCSADYTEEPATTEGLTQKAEAYINSNNLTTPKNNIKLGFAQSEELTGRVDLCDTVTIYYEALGISREQMKCIRTVWDVIREKYTETEFGDATTNLADSIIETNREVNAKPSVSYLEASVKRATELITGNLGGYVIIHDSNGDGQPDEILIMDTPDITTATKVWRWNKNGLGYSSTGYTGSFGLAMTSQGEIVADFVTTGQMSGNRVRTGLITSQNGQLILDLDNGTITAPSITLSGTDVGDRLAELEQTSIVTTYALSTSGTSIPSTFPLDAPTAPTVQQPYLWSKTVYTYADGQTNTSYGVSVRGANGQNGADGAGLAILGNYDTMADLIAAHPTGTAGQAYMVGTDLAVWNTQTNSWQDVGRIQGPSGGDGLWLAIENNDTGSNMNITYTAHLLKGPTTDVTETYDAVFSWQLVKESGITEIASGTPTITVSRDAADYGGTIRCICIAVVDEEDLQDYGYNAIQDYNGNNIQIIGANNVKLIGEAAIYKPYAISSQFQVLQDEISSKVEQTEFNSLSGTVTQQGTAIQQNAQAITLKADTTTVNNGLNGKMATDMSNRSSSIRIDSGQIRFDSNSLVVNSSQFTLDASGNATFGGNLSAATLNIGGQAVGIGTAIDNAEAGAISAAATDATNKANAAVSTAASDATTKANTAETNAKNYTDTGLSTKVGNTEVRTKFAADTHSVTITSGVIAFNSNTLSINSTNLTVTNDGQVTAKLFKAKNLFRIINNSDVVLASIEAQTNGGVIAVGRPDTTQVATMAAGTDGGAVSVGNASGTTVGLMTATTNGGYIYVKDNSGNLNVKLIAGSQGGTLSIQKSNGSDVAYIQANSAGGGTLALKNSSGTNTIVASGDTGNLTASGAISATGNISTSGSISATGNITATGAMSARSQINLNSSAGNRRALLWVGGSDDGVLNLYDSSRLRINFSGLNGVGYFYNNDGNINVELRGDTGIINCVQCNESSSRKIKKNIRPMEDAEKILDLQAVSFDFKDEERGTNQRGFIAEDVAEILPNLVTEETEGRTASIHYTGMIPYLQDIIKKQEERIKALEDKIEKIIEKEK